MSGPATYRRMVVVALLGGAGALTVPAAAQATFPGRSGEIAYARCLDAPTGPGCVHWGVMAVPSRGGTPRRIATGWGPRWSADGASVLSIGLRTWTVRVTPLGGPGRDIRLVGIGWGAKAPFLPSWFPDGRRIAFQAASTRRGGLYTIAIGRHRPRAAARFVSPTAGVLSPDGRRIAWSRVDRVTTGTGLVVVLYVARLDGTGRRDILRLPWLGTGAFPRPGRLDWSPDGRRLLFDHDGLNVINADGTGLRQIATGPLYGGHAAWSPDGRRIVFTRFSGTLRPESRSNEVVTMAADGTDLRVLVHDDWGVEQPDWQPLPSRSR